MATREHEQYEDRWRVFQQLDQMKDHWWWRPGWRVGRSFYTWHLTFEQSPELHDLVRRVERDLDVKGLDLVPEEGLHLTMQGVGFSDEVTAADVDRIAEHASALLRVRPPFELALGPVDPDAEGIGLLVEPWQDVEETRRLVRDAIAATWGADNVPEHAAGFRPHVTVAYSAGNGDLGEIRSRLESLRTLEPVTVQVQQVQLIRLNRDEKVYRWDVAHTVPLR